MQCLPQLPQLFLSVIVSTHKPSHLEYPESHCTVQTLVEHAALAWGLVGHGLPHPPQF
jgi:hypothetical protein